VKYEDQNAQRKRQPACVHGTASWPQDQKNRSFEQKDPVTESKLRRAEIDPEAQRAADSMPERRASVPPAAEMRLTEICPARKKKQRRRRNLSLNWPLRLASRKSARKNAVAGELALGAGYKDLSRQQKQRLDCERLLWPKIKNQYREERIKRCALWIAGADSHAIARWI
jgi:hypothetical protein